MMWYLVYLTLKVDVVRSQVKRNLFCISPQLQIRRDIHLPLIQEGQLSVSGERMCTILVNRLED